MTIAADSNSIPLVVESEPYVWPGPLLPGADEDRPDWAAEPDEGAGDDDKPL